MTAPEDTQLRHQAKLIESLQDRRLYDHPVESFELLETHISWVLLTGPFAYKIKKPVSLGFLDYSTLAKRHHCCLEELRLNRRYAPEIYKDVVTISGEVTAPLLNGPGTPIEYAVRMVQFPQDSLLSQQLSAGTLTPAHIDRLSETVAAFHGAIDPAPEETPYGSPAAVFHFIAENFSHVRSLTEDRDLLESLDRLEAWNNERFSALREAIEERRRGGHVRECHGDLHLNNIVLIDNRPTPFDGIEFNADLRFIDTISEIAFLTMDLEDRGRKDYAVRFLNAYLWNSGDYEGLRLLRFYQCYRAMVRAKVAAIRLAQHDLAQAEHERLGDELLGYVRLATAYTASPPVFLAITHGLSGSGKSTVAHALAEASGAIQLRSDVERKRLYGLPPLADSASAVEGGIYTREAGERTYARLDELAQGLLADGFSVIVDAAFLRQAQRRQFMDVAKKMGCPFLIVDTVASLPVLRQRVAERHAAGTDASEAGLAVLAHQIETQEPLDRHEKEFAIVTDTTGPIDLSPILARLPHG